MGQRNVFGTYNNSTYKVAYTAQVFESINQSNFLERIWRGKTAHESLQSANFQNYPVFFIKPNQSNNLLILLVIFIDKAITYKVAYMTQVFQLKVIRRTKLRTWHKSLIQSINKLIYQSTKQTINQSINLWTDTTRKNTSGFVQTRETRIVAWKPTGSDPSTKRQTRPALNIWICYGKGNGLILYHKYDRLLLVIVFSWTN